MFVLLWVSTTSFATGQTDGRGNDPELPADSMVITADDPGRGGNYLGDYNQAYYQLSELNAGLGPPPKDVYLQTPQATLEHFIRAARDTNYRRAAYALNLNLLPESVQLEEAAVLAEKLHYVVKQRVPISWGSLPDRPDGQINQSAGNSPIAGKPQRTIGFGTLEIEGLRVPLSLQRVRVEDEPPVWVISAATVENIERLYQVYGPSDFSRWVPDWAEVKILGLRLWKLVGVVVLGFLCYWLGRSTYRLLSRLLRRSEADWASDLGDRIATPVAVAAGALLFYVVMNNVLSVAGGWAPYLYSFLLIGIVVVLTWLVMRIIDYIIGRISATQVEDVSDEENLESRRLLTYISVARWVITFIVIVVGIGLILGQFPDLRNLGLSMVASAGLATIVLGIAAQSTLGNIVAGLQIAITRPARIGDSVITHGGEYGTVEDIRFTYLVVKTWDSRRIVIPLKHFIDNPFQNWSMTSSHMLKPILLHADFYTDVDKIRHKFLELCNNNENYDGESDPSVQVLEANKEDIVIRCLCSAKDAPTAWTLHVQLREAMVAYLAELREGRNLPRERVQSVDARSAAVDQD